MTSRNNEITALMTEEGIVNEFLRPIIVSEAMSYDATLKEALKISQDKESAKAIEQNMVEYLTSIKTGMGYQMAFAVSEASCAYYTYNGVSKFLDPEKDDHDVWYRDSVRSGQKYVLNVDTDEDYNWSLSIFVNTSVMDEDGTRLGCCGVGVQMGSVQELIAKYEEENDIRIFLTNRDGLIQVSSDGARIEKEYVDNSHFYKVNSEKFYTVKEKTGTTLIKYIPQLGWHLVIVDPNPNKISVSKIVLPNIIIFLLGI
ncbi:MAG: cache domain-containing protein [Lachnospiraceae bacterium]|nr:cache domain-containing protein [Lachnospiraceae bacterium]